MAAKIWSNVQIAVQSAIAASKTITGITKASPAVATSTAHGYANGDYVVLTVSGMFELDNRVVRVANVAANTFELEGVDATAYTTFTSGGAQVITFGTTLSNITDVNVSGGDFDQIDVTTIHDNVKKSIPGSASPINIGMTANWDPSDAGMVALKSASDARAQRAVRVTFSDATKWCFNGYIGATNAPTGSGQQKVTTPLTINVFGRTTTYLT
jgi:Phage tail tube protein, TTP